MCKIYIFNQEKNGIRKKNGIATRQVRKYIK